MEDESIYKHQDLIQCLIDINMSFYRSPKRYIISDFDIVDVLQVDRKKIIKGLIDVACIYLKLVEKSTLLNSESPKYNYINQIINDSKKLVYENN